MENTYYYKNKAALIEYQKKYNTCHKSKISDYNRRYYMKKKEEKMKQRKKQLKEQYKKQLEQLKQLKEKLKEKLKELRERCKELTEQRKIDEAHLANRKRLIEDLKRYWIKKNKYKRALALKIKESQEKKDYFMLSFD
jgi:DNA polymerase sigma